MKRRHVLGGLAAWPWAAAPALADTTAPGLTVLVAGPAGEQTDRWSEAWARALSPGFAGQPNIMTVPAGGLDGVTGANRLDALVVPDGKTAAMLPGAAMIAWLVGDPRVHFDPARWAPVLAGSQSGVLVARIGKMPGNAQPDLAALQALGQLRLAADMPESQDLAALLALARMGVPLAPVFGLRGTEAKTRAFVAGEVDAVFLCGEGVPEDIAPLSANGGVAVFSLGVALNGTVSPDPLFPDLPAAPQFAPMAPMLAAAYGAAAAAARLDYVMVLPRLSDPASLGEWRSAADRALGDAALQAAAAASGVALLDAPAAIAAMAPFAVAPAELAALQNFLAQRFGWHPG